MFPAHPVFLLQHAVNLMLTVQVASDSGLSG